MNSLTYEGKLIKEWDRNGRDWQWRQILRTHDVDNENCPECPQDMPQRCQCGGLIHQDDEPSFDERAWSTRCSECGSNYEYLDSRYVHAKVADPLIEDRVTISIIDWAGIWILHFVGIFFGVVAEEKIKGRKVR